MTRTMRNILAISAALVALVAGDALGFSMVGKGENYPTVQSALDGLMYVRATPAEDFGDRGTTEVFSVGRGKSGEADKLVDTYPVFLRGELLLGWSPIVGRYALVQVEPVRITSVDQHEDVGRVARLAFHLGGKTLKVYTRVQLEGLGLARRVVHLDNRLPGDFVVRGIVQIPNSNRYVLRLDRNDDAGRPVAVDFDVVTGEVVSGAPAGD